MARISTYTTDSSIDGTEFLLGRESDGTTKQFSLSALQTYLATVVSSTSTFTSTIVPNADDSLDIGSSAAQWKDLYIDGIAYIDQIGTDGDPTASAFISGGEIDGVVIGGESAAAATVTNLTITGDLNLGASTPGTSGQYLRSAGDGAVPTWDTASLNDLSDALIFDSSLYIGHDPSATDNSAQYNVAVGVTALDAITTGDKNVAIGYDAGTAITSTSDVVLVGHEAGKSLTTGQGTGSVFLGSGAGKSVTTGDYCIAIGAGALNSNTVGDHNIAIGHDALTALNVSSGDDPDANIAIGHEAGMSATSMDGAVLIGHHSGKAITTGDSNVFVGPYSGLATTTGTMNVVLGHRALAANIDGDGSVAIGHEALRFSEPSDGHTNNTAVGFAAGKNTTTGKSNTTIGMQAGSNITTGGNNTALGANALLLNDVGTDNVAVGQNSLSANVDGTGSVAVGTSSLESQDPSGAADMYNVAIGHEAGQSVTTGITNTVVGGVAGDGITTGSGNTALGYNTAFSAANASNQTVIGKDATGHGDNIVTIGNAAVTAIHPGQSGAADLGSSSYKFKDIFIGGSLHGNKIPTELVTVNGALTSNQSGKTFVFNDADGATLTLPDSGAGDLIGVYYDFTIAVTATSGAHKIVCADTTNEKLFGQVHLIDTDSSDTNGSFAAQAGDNISAITCNGTTTGIIGSTFRVQNIAADKWIVSGNIHVTGAPSTPFATS